MSAAFRERTGEVLFVDARELGDMVDRVLRAFARIADQFAEWAKVENAIRKNIGAIEFELPAGRAK